MLGYKHISSLMSVAVILLLTLVVSCNKFNYGYDENDPGASKPNEAELSFSVSWGSAGVAAADRPEQLTVLMGRKVNSLHYIWDLDSDGGFIYTPPVVEEETEQPDSDVEPDSDLENEITEELPSPKSRSIANGEYYIVAFSNPGLFYEISEYSEFQTNPAMSMRELYASLPEIPAEEVSQDQDLIDFNPYAGFYKPADEPLYIDVHKDAVLTVPSNKYNINLSPRNLTRTLTLQLKVSSEKGVVIDKISTVLSGVVTKVQLMAGLMSPTNTGKVAFDITPVRKTEEYTLYQGSVNLLGIFPPEDRAYITGPGILQVLVHASVTDEGVVKQRVFHAGLNLKSTLEEAEMMVESDDKTGYTMKQQSELRMLEIGPELKVMKNQIMSGETEGLDYWKPNDAEIVPEEIPDIC